MTLPLLDGPHRTPPSARTRFRRQLHRSGTEPLTYYSMGSGPQTVTIVNAHGHGLDHWVPLRDELMHRFRLLVWQPRGTSVPQGAITATHPVSEHVQDMAAILRQEGVSRVHLLAWSTAPRIALQFQAAHPQAVASMAFVAGRFACAAAATQPEVEGPSGSTPWAARIDVPTLFLNGDGDALAPAHATYEVAARVPGAIYAEVAGADHRVHQEFPELVGSLVREFFRRGHAFALETAGVRIERFARLATCRV
jgi:pimeloyl-ACP methyl ester carboxylesterase